jgi:hypothetical protein
MVRTHGWRPRGQRLREQAPHGHWQTLTFLAALRARPGSTRLASLTDQRRKASRPISKLYRAVPRADAQARRHGHHGQSRQPQGLCGAPGHSSPRGFCSCRATVPDLNPIEQVFAKLKTLLRNAAEPTVEATWQRIGAPLNCFAPQECANLHPKRRICCHLNGKCF